MRANLQRHITSLSIGALSRRTGFSIDTIRYYETLGLLPAVARTSGGHRQYGDAHERRLSAIRRARRLGLRLKQMHAMFEGNSRSCDDLRPMLRERADDVRRRLDELRALERDLQRLLDACGNAQLGSCRVIEAMLSAEDDVSARPCCTQDAAPDTHGPLLPRCNGPAKSDGTPR